MDLDLQFLAGLLIGAGAVAMVVTAVAGLVATGRREQLEVVIERFVQGIYEKAAYALAKEWAEREDYRDAWHNYRRHWELLQLLHVERLPHIRQLIGSVHAHIGERVFATIKIDWSDLEAWPVNLAWTIIWTDQDGCEVDRMTHHMTRQSALETASTKFHQHYPAICAQVLDPVGRVVGSFRKNAQSAPVVPSRSELGSSGGTSGG